MLEFQHFKKKKKKNYKCLSQDFFGGPLAKTPCPQFTGARFNLWSGNSIPQVASKSSHVATKDPACCNGKMKILCAATKTCHSQINK